MNDHLDYYKLMRDFWDYAFSHPHQIKPNHCAIYSFSVEHCNRLGWKEKFGFPSSMVLDAIGIKSYSVYKKCFNELVEFGFFEVIEYSKNQYSSNIIALKENNKATTKALDKALTKHSLKQAQSNYQSTVSIDKQIYNIPDTNIPNYNKSESVFNFKNEMIDFGFEINLINEWLKVRKNKKATNTETAFKKFTKQVLLCSEPMNEILELCVTKSWGSFDADWMQNIKKNELNNGSKINNTGSNQNPGYKHATVDREGIIQTFTENAANGNLPGIYLDDLGQQ